MKMNLGQFLIVGLILLGMGERNGHTAGGDGKLLHFDFNATYRKNDPDWDRRGLPQRVFLNSGHWQNNPGYRDLPDYKYILSHPEELALAGTAAETPQATPQEENVVSEGEVVPRLKILQNLFILSADLAKIQVGDLERMVNLGAEGFELPGTVSTMEDCRRIGAFIRARNLSAGLNVAVDPLRDPSSLDVFVRRAGIDYLKSRIDCAVELGATVMAGPIVLPWGGFYDTDSTEELHDHWLAPKLEVAKSSIREVAAYARQKGIKLALEPLHRHEMHGLNTMKEAAAFIKEVNDPNFGICLDTSHEVIDGAGPKVFSRLVRDLYDRGFFIYAQVSAPSRGDVKDSWIPWMAYFKLLRQVGVSSVTIEIMQAIPPFTGRNGCGIRLARLPFADPFKIVGDAIRTTRRKWDQYTTT